MKRQVIQNFLNLPGITGVALMDGRTRPFFCGLDTILNSQQKEALAQGIQQVVSTTPADFEAFSFRFGSRQAHIYKLTDGVILLVLTSNQVPFEAYVTALKQLKVTLTEDLATSVATFRLLAGCVTLNNQSYSLEASSDPSANDELAALPSLALARSQTVLWDEMMAALNHLSDFTTQYLGKVIVANAWRSARPAHSWLESVEIDRSGHFRLTTEAALAGASLTLEQQQWLKDWVQAFVKHCGKTIRDFATILTEQALDPRQKSLLLPADA
ncbi:hypothetical protein [Pseudanabaena sp. FACHB-2040]|uniref:hypothetical protein n=1 Tax=Pseudanabaena sp. FACHB-2040 TaxID=2692859 RepID=UPI0016875A08|nr:hypothetical protein [Pseudanabaena sp. FACHB-2040]MBD2256723.1 hypothetical protein [Pseudanabaena sp. FACHB-2040]